MSSEPGPSASPGILRLRTGAWYGDHVVDLELPDPWDVSVFTPRTTPALTDAEIRERLESPVDGPPIRERCSGASRALIIVDDLNRPTPAARLLPVLVDQFAEAGIPAGDVTILIGPGTHAPPAGDAVAKKVGADLLASCRVRVHDRDQEVVKLGRTSCGTPVFVSKEVAEADYLVAVGGVYPNHTGGFGGGSKAALGVLGFRSIAALHFGHDSAGWGSRAGNDSFRHDLDEIAQLIGLRTGIFVVIDGEREIVDLACGDIGSAHARVLGSVGDAFRAPRPDPEARVVISNAYPSDLSLTFVRMKGTVPLAFAPPGASRIVVASCDEGLGFHGLFPFMNAPRLHRERMLGLRIAANLGKPRRFARKAMTRLARVRTPSSAPAQPTWLYCPSPAALARLPTGVPGFRITSSWREVVEGVAVEQGRVSPLRTFVYTAAPLQWLG